MNIRLLLTSAASFHKLMSLPICVQVLSQNRREDKIQACLEHNTQFVKGSYLPCTQLLITDIIIPWTTRVLTIGPFFRTTELLISCDMRNKPIPTDC